MSWLWIYITLMEWVGIVLVVKALGDDTNDLVLEKQGSISVCTLFIQLHLIIFHCHRCFQ